MVCYCVDFYTFSWGGKLLQLSTIPTQSELAKFHSLSRNIGLNTLLGACKLLSVFPLKEIPNLLPDASDPVAYREAGNIRWQMSPREFIQSWICIQILIRCAMKVMPIFANSMYRKRGFLFLNLSIVAYLLYSLFHLIILQLPSRTDP